MISGARRAMALDVARMAAAVGAVLLVVAVAFRWGTVVDRLRTAGPAEELLIVTAFAFAVMVVAGAGGWLAARLGPGARLAAAQRAGRRGAWGEFRRLSTGTGTDADESAVAAMSAPLAAMAWDDATPGHRAIEIATHLAGNEAETHLFGLDRLAYCCRADGAVPIAPAERLAAAEALAVRGTTLLAAGWSPGFPAAGLALVRLAQLRRDEAAELLRPHVRDGDDAGWAQLRALFGVALLDADPDAARREARAAWERLSETERRTPAAATVAHALAYVERHTA